MSEGTYRQRQEYGRVVSLHKLKASDDYPSFTQSDGVSCDPDRPDKGSTGYRLHRRPKRGSEKTPTVKKDSCRH